MRKIVMAFIAVLIFALCVGFGFLVFWSSGAEIERGPGMSALIFLVVPCGITLSLAITSAINENTKSWFKETQKFIDVDRPVKNRE